MQPGLRYDLSKAYYKIGGHNNHFKFSLYLLKIIHTFYNSKELNRTVTKFSFQFQPFAVYAELLTLKLSLTCLFVSLIELLNFRLASSAKWCILEYFIACSRPLIYVTT